MGFEPHRARTLAMRFRRHSVDQLHALAPHFRDESKLVSLARAGRQQLEQLFAQERLDRPAAAPSWDAPPRPQAQSGADAPPPDSSENDPGNGGR